MFPNHVVPVVLYLIGVDDSSLRGIGSRPVTSETGARKDDVGHRIFQLTLMGNRVSNGVAAKFHPESTVVQAQLIIHVIADLVRPANSHLLAGGRNVVGIA